MGDYGGYDDGYGGPSGGYGGYGGVPPGGGYVGSYGGPPARGGPPPPGPGGYGGYPGYGPPMGGPPGGGYDPRGPKGGPPGGGGAPFAQDSPLDAEVAAVLHEIRTELGGLEASPEFSSQYRNAKRLLQCEVVKLENNIDPEWLELDIEKQIKLVKKVLIPQFRYPRFNFVGKIIGPKGVTLQNIAKVFKCHVYVLGRGSTRDRNKEQELLASGDPQYSHYGGPLHVKIETTAPPPLAYKRVTGVMEVLKQLLNPVKDTYIEGITPEESKEGAKNNDHDSGGDDEPRGETFNSEDYNQKNGGDRGDRDRGNDRGGRGGGGDRGGRGRGGGGRGGGGNDPYRGPPSVGLGGGPMRGPRGGGPPRGRGGPPGGGRGGRGGGGGGRGGGPPRFQPY